MIFPKPLKPGDKVALIAPSSPIADPENLEYALHYTKSLDFEPVVGKSCRSHYGHLAGDDATRAADINQAFADNSIKGIFCVQGGNGAAKTLDKIDFAAIKANPKFFCGFSDITALHSAINRLGIATYHTPMFAGGKFEEADVYTADLLKQFIFNPQYTGEMPLPDTHNTQTLAHGTAEGIICGGNLSCLSALMGTPYEIVTLGKIFFIEEVGTNPPRTDRMLNGLRLAGKFEQCVGVIFGDFTNCNPIDPAFSLTIDEILHNLNLKVPAVYNFPCGHILPTASLPFGSKAQLDATNCKLHIV